MPTLSSRPRPHKNSRDLEAGNENTENRHNNSLHNDEIRKHLVAALGEFVGTFLFLFFAFGGTQVAKNLPKTVDPASQLLYISLSFGFSLAISVWCCYRISGGLFNPAVTLGMCISGTLPWIRGLVLLPVQIVSGIAAAAVIDGILPGPMTFQTRLGDGTSKAQGVFLEMFLTSLLVFTVLMLAAEKTRATYLAPVGIGLALFVAELTGLPFTGGSLNPSRSFGPDVVMGSFPGYHWIYWVGPALGAGLAAGYYKINKLLDYESANPGQDDASQSYERRDT